MYPWAIGLNLYIDPPDPNFSLKTAGTFKVKSSRVPLLERKFASVVYEGASFVKMI